MRAFRLLAAGFLVFALLGTTAAQTPEQRLKREEEKLAGVWRLTGMEAEGQKVPLKEGSLMTLTFKAGKFTVQVGSKDELQEGTYKIDPSKSPRAIDINRTNGPEEGRRQVGIYELTGNLLKICASEASKDRPTNFDTRDKPGYTVLLFKRTR
jgi:uncharacterized protein (TIGR03067 family)